MPSQGPCRMLELPLTQHVGKLCGLAYPFWNRWNKTKAFTLFWALLSSPRRRPWLSLHIKECTVITWHLRRTVLHRKHSVSSSPQNTCDWSCIHFLVLGEERLVQNCLPFSLNALYFSLRSICNTQGEILGNGWSFQKVKNAFTNS